jgi:PAS domain S-box-containing protein
MQPTPGFSPRAVTATFLCLALAWLAGSTLLIRRLGADAAWPLAGAGLALAAAGGWWLHRDSRRRGAELAAAKAAREEAERRCAARDGELADLRRAHDDLRLLRAALEAAPLAWVVTDREGRLLWANPAFTALTGHAVADVTGQPLRFLRSGRHAPEFYEEFWATILRGEVWAGDIHNVRKDGTHFREHLIVAPVRADGSEVTHFVAVKRDVTDERRLESEAARAQRVESIGLLACGIAHDLNNVLSAILLSVDLMRTDPRSVTPQALELVHHSARRGAEIVRQVLVFARGADGERGEVDAARLVRDIARFIEETFPRNLEVRVALSPDLGSVQGDVTQLHQVLLNLAVNARDALPNGGLITLGGEVVELGAAGGGAALTLPVKPGRYVALRVADSGPGMPPEVVGRLFEPFFTTKPRGRGTGLGLSTAQAIVRSHGGAIQVRTEPDIGSTFTVLLPRRAGAPGGPVAGPGGAGVVAGAGRRILVVDDEPAILEVLARMLRRHGFEVRCARDGLEGRTVFLAGGPWHAALIDQQMPRVDGLRLIADLRTDAPGLPVVLMSGVVHDPGPADARGPDPWELGVRTFLAKPFTELELLQALRREIALPPRN